MLLFSGLHVWKLNILRASCRFHHAYINKWYLIPFPTPQHLLSHCQWTTSALPLLLVIPVSPCWPCEPQASAVGRWDLPLRLTKQPDKCVKVTVGCKAVLMTFKNVKSAQPPTIFLYLLPVLLRESEPASLLKKSQKKKNEVTSAFLTSTESHRIEIRSLFLR